MDSALGPAVDRRELPSGWRFFPSSQHRFLMFNLDPLGPSRPFCKFLSAMHWASLKAMHPASPSRGTRGTQAMHRQYEAALNSASDAFWCLGQWDPWRWSDSNHGETFFFSPDGMERRVFSSRLKMGWLVQTPVFFAAFRMGYEMLWAFTIILI